MGKPVPQPPKPLLAVDNLSVELGRRPPRTKIVHGVSFNVMAGEKVALVGESGSGKSVSALSVLRLHETGAVRYPSGAIYFNGSDLLKLDDKALRAVRGKEIGMIFQEPMTSLNPVQPIGAQLIESLRIHENITRSAAKKRMLDLLERTGISEPGKRFDAFPHMLSGGQRQRVMIAMALACHPKLLIADEPTTALDVTIQAQILDLMHKLQEKFDSAIMMITHNLGVINEMADRIAVMYLGKVVEIADRETIFRRPAHPYTVGLLQSVPEMGNKQRSRLHPIPGIIPDPFNIPKGCAFFDRCPVKHKKSACKDPAGVPLIEIEPGHMARCTLYSEIG